MSFESEYVYEMGRLTRLSDRELEQLAAGTAPAGDDTFEDVAALLGTVRATCVVPPDEVTQALHLAEITREAQLVADGEPVVADNAAAPERQAPGQSKWKRRLEVARSTAIKLAAGITAAMLSTAGLAYAGVDLPGQAAEKAIDAVLGVELPNQSGGDVEVTREPDESADQTAWDVWNVISNWVGERGCAFGQAVANAATEGENAPDCTAAEGAGSQGAEASAEGRATAGEASGGASDAGADNAGTNDDSGRATAGEASGGASDAGGDNAGSSDDEGRATAEESSSAGQEKGETESEAGQSKNPTGNGRP